MVFEKTIFLYKPGGFQFHVSESECVCDVKKLAGQDRRTGARDREPSWEGYSSNSSWGELPTL